MRSADPLQPPREDGKGRRQASGRPIRREPTTDADRRAFRTDAKPRYIRWNNTSSILATPNYGTFDPKTAYFRPLPRLPATRKSASGDPKVGTFRPHRHIWKTLFCPKTSPPKPYFRPKTAHFRPFSGHKKLHKTRNILIVKHLQLPSKFTCLRPNGREAATTPFSRGHLLRIFIARCPIYCIQLLILLSPPLPYRSVEGRLLPKGRQQQGGSPPCQHPVAIREARGQAPLLDGVEMPRRGDRRRSLRPVPAMLFTACQGSLSVSGLTDDGFDQQRDVGDGELAVAPTSCLC